VNDLSEQIPQAVWSRFVAGRSAGELVDALVLRVLPFGSLVEIDGVAGLLPRSAADPAPEAGSRLPIRVTTIDVTRRRFTAEAA
jgi:ribosomal protein S1